MLFERTLYALDDVTVIPAVTSDIRHRSEINIFYNDRKYANDESGMEKHLPIFVSPMASVINKDNYSIWTKNGLVGILPRTEKIDLRIKYATSNRWAAFSLEEFEDLFCDGNKPIISNPNDNDICVKVLVDMANGHIKAILDDIKKAKEISKTFNYTLDLMVGNAAHPETYGALAEAGADYVRMSVGDGSVCITASNTGTNYPMASLLDDSRKIKHERGLSCKIVADGGINSYAKAIKAFALGADYIMLGSALAKCFESAGEFVSVEHSPKDYTAYSLYELNNLRWNPELAESEKKEIIKNYAPMTKTIFGMSTRKAQALIQMAKGVKKSDIKTKTSEGIEKPISVDYTVAQWVENFGDYFRSNMSYCNFTDVNDYIGNATVMLRSEAAKNSINK